MMMRFFALGAKKSALTLLKQTQQKNAAHFKKRKRYAYDNNHSAAIALPIATAELERKKNDALALVNLSKDLIVEHAARRVDLFFYTLIAYHQTNLHPRQGHTELQYGKGRSFFNTSITQACHSSFIPAFVDETMTSEAVDTTTHESILTGTHFMNSINSTIELPALVNQVDDALEITYSCREKSLKIIQSVSIGEINPEQGLQQFFQMMQKTFNNISTQDPIQQFIIALEKKGTFAGKFSAEQESINSDYLESLLRLGKQEKQYLENHCGNKAFAYLYKMKEIQEEILNTKSPKPNSRM